MIFIKTGRFVFNLCMYVALGNHSALGLPCQSLADSRDNKLAGVTMIIKDINGVWMHFMTPVNFYGLTCPGWDIILRQDTSKLFFSSSIKNHSTPCFAHSKYLVFLSLKTIIEVNTRNAYFCGEVKPCWDSKSVISKC